jgi:hypothetical protein
METVPDPPKPQSVEAEPFPVSEPIQTESGEDLTSGAYLGVHGRLHSESKCELPSSSYDLRAPELQVPRKREREISLEPATPQSTAAVSPRAQSCIL